MIDIMGTKMKKEDWDKSEFFKSGEAWGNADHMAKELIQALNDFRKYVGKPITIHCGTQGAHVTDSAHYRGEAVDLHVSGMHCIDQFLAATRFAAFRGIGLYPFWNSPGLHLDVRFLAFNEPRARWMRNKSGVYVVISADTLKNILKG